MLRYLYYVLFFVWFACAIVFSNLLFYSGFLFNKVVIEKQATCLNYEDIKNNLDNTTNKVDVLWHTRKPPMCMGQQARVVLLLIDGFGHNFAGPYEQRKKLIPYENKLPILSELLGLYPTATRFFRISAERPTNTAQRVKALTAGSFPTFIDAGSQFPSRQVTEDNILTQLASNNKSIVFMGDSTWADLYPDHFLRQYLFQASNSSDLDIVDKGINANIYKELAQDDWDLLIAHYVGSHHCERIYSEYNEEYNGTLTKMNDVIREIVSKLPLDAMLVVIGDHGKHMISGLEMYDEHFQISSGIFVHASFALTEKQNNQYSRKLAKEMENITQADVIPTLAAVLGVPVPYSNVGRILLDCLPYSSKWENYFVALWQNVHQITNYLMEYSEHSDQLKEQELEDLNIDYQTLASQTAHINERNFESFAANAMRYITHARMLCRSAWNKYNGFYLTWGAMTFSLITLLVYQMMDALPDDEKVFEFCRFSCYGLYCSSFASVGIVYILHDLKLVDKFWQNAVFMAAVAAIIMFLLFVLNYFECITDTYDKRRKMSGYDDMVARMILSLSCFVFTSGEYLLEEPYWLGGLLIVALLVNVVTGWLQINEKYKTTGLKLKQKIKTTLIALTTLFLAMSLLSVFYWVDRAEHNCNEYNATEKVLNNHLYSWFIGSVLLIAILVISKAWLNYCSNLTSPDTTVSYFKYTPSLIIVCMSSYWAINVYPEHERVKKLPTWSLELFAWGSYGLIIIGMIVVLISPIAINVYNDRVLKMKNDNVIAVLFTKIRNKRNANRNANDEAEDNVERMKTMPLVEGLPTAYSAPFLIAVVYITLLLFHILGINYGSSLCLLLCSMFVAMAIFSIIRFEKATSVDDLLEVPSSVLVFWMILASYYFYGTGHQPTLPNIPWKVEFADGLGLQFKTIVPVMYLLFHTFGSYILTGVAIPLLQLAPLTFYKIVWYTDRNARNSEITLGEMAWFDKDDILLSSTGRMCIKYIIYHCCRWGMNMIFAMIHCRHVTVWNLYTPRLLFESGAILVTMVSVLIGYIIYVHTVKAINQIVKSLESQFR